MHVPTLGLLVNPENDSFPATTYIRIFGPLSKISNNRINFRIVNEAWLLSGGINAIDALVIQRDAVSAEVSHLLIKKVKDARLKYAYEIDDLLWEIPPNHPEYEIYQAKKSSILELMSHADLIVTSTASLANLAAEINPSVFIIPNGINKQYWLKPNSEAWCESVIREQGLDLKCRRILYMGTKSHKEDLEMIAPALSYVLEKYPDIEIIQIGGGYQLPGARYLSVPKRYCEYPDFVAWFRAIATTATIGLAPLKDTHFNNAKSDIKAFDYALAGVPTIFSKVPPYTESVEHLKTGMLCENDFESWQSSIIQLITDNVLRQRIIDCAYKRAINRLENDSTRHAWERVIDSLTSRTV